MAAAHKTPSATVSTLHSLPAVSRVTEKSLTATPVTVSSRLSGVTNVINVTLISVPRTQVGVTVTPKSSSPKTGMGLGSGKLPDLVVNPPGILDQLNMNIHDSTVDPPTTEDEGDAVDALLSLGSDLSNTVSMDDMLNKNATLMSIGAPTVQDVNLVDINLDQVSVDKTIANIIDQEQAEDAAQLTDQTNKNTSQNPDNQLEIVPDSANKKPVSDHSDDSEATVSALDDTVVDTSSSKTNKEPTMTPHRGKVEFKEYSVKRKVDDGKLKFVCPNCKILFKTRCEQNTHYCERHDPIMCSKCDKLFNNPASFSVHMYDHMEHCFRCKICNRGFHFQGQLKQQKVLHRKEGQGTFQCMSSKCGKLFVQKGDLVVHLESHKKKDWNCPHCDHVTTCKKYLKTYIKSRHETDEANYPYKCAVCNRKFLYRTQLSRHKESHLKSSKA